MRKFIIKNRAKRKYTKKSEQNSSLIFGKTLAGMLPLLIMLITLMATIVISTSTRNPLGDIHFRFDPSRISFHNPVEQLALLGANLVDTLKTVEEIFAAWWIAFLQFMQITEKEAYATIVLLDPTPLFISLGNFITSVSKELTSFLTTIYYVIQALLSTFFGMLLFILKVAWTAMLGFLQMLFNAAFLGIQSIFVWASSVGITIVHWFSAILQTFIKAIEWPFKETSAYFMQYKPIIDVLGQHMLMALRDTGRCFVNLNQTIHVISSSK